MRWTLVTETYPPEVNGVAMTLERLCAAMAGLGCEVSVVRPAQTADSAGGTGAADRTGSTNCAGGGNANCQGNGDSAGDAGYADNTERKGNCKDAFAVSSQSALVTAHLVRGVPIPGYRGLQFGFFCGGALRRLWQRQRPDVVHIATEGPLGFSALRAAKALGIPVVSTFHTNFHSYGEHYHLGLLKRPLVAYLRWFHNRTQCTFVPSQDVRGALAAEGFGRLELMGRGVDTQLFGAHRRSVALRAQWGADAQTPVVLYAGRVAAEKNVPLALRAFERLRQRAPAAKMVIVGDGPLRAELERRHPHIHFAGMRHGEDLAAHYASADCFLFASVTETFGNVVTEAMASALAVLAYDYAAPGRYIIDGVNGFKAPLGDEAALLERAAQIGELIADGSLAALDDIRQKAAQTMAELSWESIARAYAQRVSRELSAGASVALR